MLFYNSICSSQSESSKEIPSSDDLPKAKSDLPTSDSSSCGQSESSKEIPSSDLKNTDEYPTSQMRKDAEEIFEYLFEDGELRSKNLEIINGDQYKGLLYRGEEVDTLYDMQRFFFIDRIRNNKVIDKGNVKSGHDVKPELFNSNHLYPSKEEYFSSNSTFIMNYR